MRANRSAQGRMGRRGFSIVELLIAIAVLGIMFAIGITTVGATIRRQRLNSAAEELKTLAGRALTTMQQENQMTFLVIGRYVAGVGTDAAVVIDANGNNVCDEAIDPNNDGLLRDDAPRNLVPWRMRIPADVALSNVALNGQVFNTQWARPASGTISAVIQCDFMGRTLIPATTAPTPPATAISALATGPATVQLSHEDMISGALTPLVTYTVSVTPLFKASIRRVP